MRLYLQLEATENNPVKFCHLVLQQDLLGGWTLLREAGFQGSRGTLKRWQHATRDQAYEALTSERDRLLSRGYRVMFGTGSPVEVRHAS